MTSSVPRPLQERALGLGSHAPRLSTGIETLDRACRGGLPTRRLVVIGGAPGARKTSLLAWLAVEFLRAGAIVGFLAADEDADTVLVRIGQQLGFDRTALEGGVEVERARFAKQLEAFAGALHLFDGDEDEASVESAAEHLAAVAAGRPAVLLVDSIQVVNAAGTSDADGKKARAELVVAALKSATKDRRLLTIATSELARVHYGSIDELAAFKESGAIEYGVAVAMLVREVAEDDQAVDVGIVKNRLGRNGVRFRLRMDAERATFAEVRTSSVPSGPKRQEQTDDAKVLARLSAVDGPISTTAARGKNQRGEVPGDRAVAALRRLAGRGLVRQVGDKWEAVHVANSAAIWGDQKGKDRSDCAEGIGPPSSALASPSTPHGNSWGDQGDQTGIGPPPFRDGGTRGTTPLGGGPVPSPVPSAFPSETDPTSTTVRRLKVVR